MPQRLDTKTGVGTRVFALNTCFGAAFSALMGHVIDAEISVMSFYFGGSLGDADQPY